jgi:cytochrome c peroxidase
MRTKSGLSLLLLLSVFLFSQCKKEPEKEIPVIDYEVISKVFGTNINLNALDNYARQTVPNYIQKNNFNMNLSDAKAMLGRVLFYDNKLSIDSSVSCATCHQQQFAFSDTSSPSKGVKNGLTGRQSMRLVNVRYAVESKFFWDERAASLEQQTTQPIKDHAEMGFSGIDGRPEFNQLMSNLSNTNYYQELFIFVYGDASINETRIQESLSHFIRSIQSFDSKYDIGRAMVNNNNQNFPNYTPQENMGKNLFNTPPVFDANSNRISGGLGCNGCHNAPEFDIDPNTGNNGIVGKLNATGIDITNTRAPTLRDLVNPSGVPNTPMMHTGIIKTLQAAIGHYGTINLAPGNNRLDPRLRPNGIGQKLNLTATEVNAVIAFLKTLSGTALYQDKKWSDPFVK